MNNVCSCELVDDGDLHLNAVAHFVCLCIKEHSQKSEILRGNRMASQSTSRHRTKSSYSTCSSLENEIGLFNERMIELVDDSNYDVLSESHYEDQEKILLHCTCDHYNLATMTEDISFELDLEPNSTGSSNSDDPSVSYLLSG